jgi:hypothetical protein
MRDWPWQIYCPGDSPNRFVIPAKVLIISVTPTEVGAQTFRMCIGYESGSRLSPG